MASSARPKPLLKGKPRGRRPAETRLEVGSDTRPEAAAPGDVALVFGRDEHGVHVLRRRGPDAPVEAGVLQPLVEGKPITEEVVSLRPRADAPLVFDVSTVLERPVPRAAGEGPSQVATDEYRKGWDSIWGRKGSGARDLN